MNNLQKIAFHQADMCFRYLTPGDEANLIDHCLYFIEDPTRSVWSEDWKVPFIQRQRFAELIHYYWLCFSRGIEIIH